MRPAMPEPTTAIRCRECTRCGRNAAGCCCCGGGSGGCTEDAAGADAGVDMRLRGLLRWGEGGVRRRWGSEK